MVVVVPIPPRLLVESKEQLAAETAERRKTRTRTYSVEAATDYLRSVVAGNRFHLLALCLYVSAFAVSRPLVLAQAAPPPLPSEAELEGLLALYDVPGASMAFLSDCGVVATVNAGSALLSPDVPVADNTVFEAASLSKPVFAYLVLQLVDEGVIELDRPIAKDIDYPRITDKDAFAKLTPRLVLTHRTGMPNWVDGETPFFERTAPIPFGTPPGTAYSYSGEAFMLLQTLVEQKTGKGLEQLFRERLGERMPHSSFEGMPAGTQPTRGYRGALDTVGSRRLAKYGARAMAPSSLVTTAADFGAFVGYICGGGDLRAATYAEMLRPQSPVPVQEAGVPASYGLGWMLVFVDGDTLAVHAGNNDEYRALAGFSTVNREGFVTFTNGARGEDFNNVISTPLPAPPAGPSAPEAAFEELWRLYADNYALFGVKRTDWNEVHAVYRPRVTAATTEAELWDVATDMLGLLNDVHVSLSDGATDRQFRSGGRSIGAGPFDDGRFDVELISGKYLRGGLTELPDGHLSYGWLADSVGYLRLERFGDPEPSAAATDEALRALAGARAFVIDVRHNGGGQDRAGQAIASRFADEERVYMEVSPRLLTSRQLALAPPITWRLRPGGLQTFDGPVAVLTDSRTISAAENFVLAMRTLPHARIIGTTTAGAMADSPALPLSNGWVATVPLNVFRDAAGVCYEGLGIAPDLYVENEVAAISGGRDEILEMALAVLAQR